MFFKLLFDDPIYYVSVVMAVLLSVTLHEVGHAVAAWWEGDSTARDLGHFELNPMIHMGPTAIIVLLLVGITWGQTPVQPHRFRHGRTGEALVAFAGPAVNLGLGVLFTVMSVLWIYFGTQLPVPDHFYDNLGQFLGIGAVNNFMLCLFNLLPVPPLDGFTVATSLSPALDRAADGIRQNSMILFLIVFMFAGRFLWPIASGAVSFVTSLVVMAISGVT